MTGIRILCVDPDDGAREAMAEALRTNLPGMDPDVDLLGTLGEAEAALEDGGVDCVVTEYDVPGGTGLDLADRTRSLVPDASVILFTEANPEEMETAHLGATVTEYLDKGVPDAVDRLAGLVQMTVALRSQISYPLPRNEDERLTALGRYDLDGEDLRRSLDRVADLAAEHFGVDSASVNVVEARDQRVLASRGRDADPGETVPRERSVCTFTILEEDGVMAVEDVREDPRFEPDAEVLEAAGVRSYMGAAMVTPSGLAIGTVRVADPEVRAFSAAEEAYLETLAAVAMDLIEGYGRPEAPKDAPGRREASAEGPAE